MAPAKLWLARNHFSALVPPASLVGWFRRRVPGLSNLFGRMIYDVLHCFFIGLLTYFMDAITLIIVNAHIGPEKGYVAVGEFESRIGSLPAHNTGFRCFRRYKRGFTRKGIFSGTDRFFLTLTFSAAIGLDSQVIPDEKLRAEVLYACEAASVLALLLHASALTPEARQATYDATRRFLKVLKREPFLSRQTSRYEIVKFHLLMHIINWLDRGAPASANSSKFEAALRIFVARIAKLSSRTS